MTKLDYKNAFDSLNMEMKDELDHIDMFEIQTENPSVNNLINMLRPYALKGDFYLRMMHFLIQYNIPQENKDITNQRMKDWVEIVASGKYVNGSDLSESERNQVIQLRILAAFLLGLNSKHLKIINKLIKARDFKRAGF